MEDIMMHAEYLYAKKRRNGRKATFGDLGSP